MIKSIKAIINYPGIKRYSINTIWLFIEKSLRIISGLFVGVWVARHLGPELYGSLSYIISFVALFAAFSTLGLDVVLVRELVKTKEKSNTLLGTTFILKLVGAVLSIFLIFISTYFISNDNNTNVMILIVSLTMICSCFNVVDLFFKSKVKSKYIAYVNIAALTLSSIIRILLILNNGSLNAFVYMLLFDSIFFAIGCIYIYLHNKLSIRLWNFESKVALSLFKDSWPLLFSGIAIAIYMRVDQIMIKEMLDFNSVGQYAAAVKISEAWYFIPMILGASLAPAIINAKEKSELLYYTRLQNFYTLMVWLAIIVAIPIALFSRDIIEILFGIEYLEAAQVLVIHVWSGVFLALGVACGKWYLAENYTRGALYKALVGMFVNIVCNYVFIPKYGINGAAYSTLIAQFSANVLYDIFDNRVRGQLKYKFKAFFPYYLLRGNQFVK